MNPSGSSLKHLMASRRDIEKNAKKTFARRYDVFQSNTKLSTCAYDLKRMTRIAIKMLS